MLTALVLPTYYLALLLISLAGVAYGYFFSAIFFPSAKDPGLETALTIFKCSWLVALPYAILNYYSLLRYPVCLPPSVKPIPQALNVQLYFRFVTRGHNPNLVAETVAGARRMLEPTVPTDWWRIEVVTDRPLALDESDGQVRVIVVPVQYHLARGTKYKARALHYALSVSHATPADWVVHLDEETRFDQDTVRTICDFVARETNRLAAAPGPDRSPRIGQGIVLYGNGKVVNWTTNLADSLRVGDDYGRFRLQFENGKAYFGMHGSFIVVNCAVEQRIGFDHGFVGSITEDAYFALTAQSAGIQFEFLHAFMFEKSPFSLRDFVKQRRRWFGGLWLCALTPNIPLRQRLMLGSFVVLWSISWLCILMVYVNFFYPTGTPAWLGIMGGLSFSYYVLLYLVGYVRTFDWRTSKLAFVARLLAQVALIPFFSVLEAAGVFYGVVSPPKDFYIVQKELAPQSQARPAVGRPGWLAKRWAIRVRGAARQVRWLPGALGLRLYALWQKIPIRDTVTGLHTYAYWLRALHLQGGQAIRRPLPTMCLTLEVRGLDALRARHGTPAADQVMAQIGAALTRSLRAYDLVCRYHDQHFAAALLQCSTQFGQGVGERVLTRLNRQLLPDLNQRYGTQLGLAWQVAPLPNEPLTLESLWRATLRLLEQPLLNGSGALAPTG